MTQSPSPKSTIIDILHVANWLQGRIADILAPHNVSLQQVKVLAIIFEQTGQFATVGTIREKMQDPMSNVSRLLNKLVEKGLVSKEHGTDDQRVVHIHILPAGVEVMSNSRQAIDEGLDVLCHLSSDELSSLSSLLSKIKE
ncbi:MarR family winged helix-turn-helix transcriptional regulator [Leucothrix arctica]|uniref:MarR family transcriptional regulator n=1 Tax=Leucothrix arctica TaxID=1481894 RepID=A0A317CEE9_9GAMM|nr:MarR family transcriptional regulator [Leucothrix arctica]PWQ96938.1 MarR family transcriptional regulator [Leucothrix arctica]